MQITERDVEPPVLLLQHEGAHAVGEEFVAGFVEVEVVGYEEVGARFFISAEGEVAGFDEGEARRLLAPGGR